jgi:hypothetical protein
VAGSIALVGFGVDDERIEQAERRTYRLVAVSFVVLAAYVGFEAIRTLVGQACLMVMRSMMLATSSALSMVSSRSP